MARLALPKDADTANVEVAGRSVHLTNLRKVYWPERGFTKRDLLAYYAAVAPALLPHVRDKAIVMKRYPNGIGGAFFFMKRVPAQHPPWLKTCAIEHGSGSVIDFAIVDDVASLLWLVNLGCIDLNPWYAPCDDVNHPEYLHFDLDPNGAPFSAVREAALIVHDTLEALGMPTFAKTSGSKGMHVYVPIEHGPTQKEVWTFAKLVSMRMAGAHPDVLTAEYKIAKRPEGRVLVDYNQNRWGATLASVYSVRPTPHAGVSTPVTWEEVERGVETEDFTLLNVPQRLAKTGDLWKPLAQSRGRFDLAPLLAATHVA
ncbi:MAG TPA: non-homologous end-joining DNA ligase [Candidatus Baltobacteraceae bacterium]|jgi:bifunctional non-homologous end joining protein LigD